MFTMFCEIGEPYKHLFERFLNRYGKPEESVYYVTRPYVSDKMVEFEPSYWFTKVYGGYGELTVALVDGSVHGLDTEGADEGTEEDPVPYRDIVQFDLAEFRGYYGPDHAAFLLLGGVDICLLRFLSETGERFEPNFEMRRRVALELCRETRANAGQAAGVEVTLNGQKVYVDTANKKVVLDLDAEATAFTADIERTKLVFDLILDHINNPGKY